MTSAQTFVNLTPHSLTLCIDEETEITLPSQGNIRVPTAPQRDLGTIEGVPVVSPQVATLFDAATVELVRRSMDVDEKGDARGVVITSVYAAEEIAAQLGLVAYAPDTGPDSVIRDESGRIKAIRRLVKFDPAHVFAPGQKS